MWVTETTVIWSSIERSATSVTLKYSLLSVLLPFLSLSYFSKLKNNKQNNHLINVFDIAHATRCRTPTPTLHLPLQCTVLQGYGGGTGRLDDFYSFDFDTTTWEQVHVLGDEKPGCRENNGVVISDSSRSIYLFGGYNGTSWLNDLWKVRHEIQK